jgi:hypothetical protein
LLFLSLITTYTYYHPYSPPSLLFSLLRAESAGRYVACVDAFVFETLFLVCALANTLAAKPSLRDFLRVFRVLGISSLFSPSSAQSKDLPVLLAHLSHFIITSMREQMALHISRGNFSAPPVLHDVHLHDVTSSIFPTLLILPFLAHSRRTKSIYVGPWIIPNLGNGDCMYYSMVHALMVKIYSSKAYVAAEPSTKPRDRNFLPEHPTLYKNMMSTRAHVHNYYATSLEEPHNDAMVTYLQDNQPKTVPMTRAMFLYSTSSALKDKEDIDYSPSNARVLQLAQRELQIMITPQCPYFPGPASAYAFMARLKEQDGAIAFYSLRSDTGKLQRSGSDTCIVQSRGHLASVSDDIILVPGLTKSHFPIDGPKTLDLKVQPCTEEEWNLPERRRQDHFSIFFHNQHYEALVSAIGFFELLAANMDVSMFRVFPH